LKTPTLGCNSSGLQRWKMLFDYLSNNFWLKVSSMLWSLPILNELIDSQYEHHTYAFERLTKSIPTRKKTQEFKLVMFDFSFWNSQTQIILLFGERVNWSGATSLWKKIQELEFQLQWQFRPNLYKFRRVWTKVMLYNLQYLSTPKKTSLYDM
jgi:hypothetical protein